MKRAVAVLLAVVLLSGCAATPDAAYLSTVRQSIPAVKDVPDDTLTGLGHSVCDLLNAKGFKDGMVAVVAQIEKAGLTAADAGHIAGAASAAYCPSFSDDFK